MFNSERARGAYILELSGAGLQREGRDQRWPSREAQQVYVRDRARKEHSVSYSVTSAQSPTLDTAVAKRTPGFLAMAYQHRKSECCHPPLVVC